jgi:hypothetical protein
LLQVVTFIKLLTVAQRNGKNKWSVFNIDFDKGLAMTEELLNEQEVPVAEVPKKKKAEKPARYLAIYKTTDASEESCLHYVTAPNGLVLRKLLDNVPVENIVLIWKGKAKEVYLKSVVTF